ncbi:Lcl domain-containing protein [Polaribacter marinivivus]|uniref:DUF1566 domain-containing protein n=1 Tax=Polaribacter marinivivus TaxID=1524260 RepID=A0ABV8R5T6_9FLAO
MKNKIQLIIALLICGITLAQTPEKISYQAIVRNADGNLISDTSVSFKISILEGSSTGNAVFVETHSPTTNTNGLVTIEIGTGKVISGAFASIDWGSGDFFIKTETDITGGTNYTISGTSQLLSVPYALHAKKADNVPNYKVGDFVKGGIVFWVDETGQHGLVCAKDNLSTSTKWFSGTFGNTYAKGDGVYAGKANNAIIMSTHAAIGDDGILYAARLCNELKVVENNVTYGDWYLPSLHELNLMYQNRSTINTVSTANGGEAFEFDVYWSSTEESDNRAWIVNFGNGQETNVLKSVSNNVRAIRSF